MTRARPLIAVVDDDVSVRRALWRLLSSADLDVETFESGQAFLDSLAVHSPDCLLLDLHMREVSGFDVQHALSQSAISIPVIVITANDEPRLRARSLGYGAVAFLLKPIDSTALLAAIARAVATSAATDNPAS